MEKHLEAFMLKELKVKYNIKDRSSFKINSSRAAYDYAYNLYQHDINIYESMFAIYLSRANNIIGWIKISQGGITGTVGDVRLIMSYGLNCLACGIILIHNHPSGALNPSEADNKITEQIKQAGQLMQITLLDHIIINDNSYYSYADEEKL